MNNSDRSPEVAILGTGPAAFATSLCLTKHGISTLVMGRENCVQNSVGEHLAPRARQLLLQVDENKVLASKRHLRSRGIVSHWGLDEPYERDYLMEPWGTGWNLDRSEFDKALIQATRKSGSRFSKVSRIQHVSHDGKSWQLKLLSDKKSFTIRPRFLVDATGRSAHLSRKLGCRTMRLDRLVGLYANIPRKFVKSGHEDTRLHLEATESGWWYSLLLRDHSMIAVFLTDADLIPPGKDNIEDWWRKQLHSSFLTISRMSKDVRATSFRIVPAHSQFIKPSTGKYWLAVGDAALAADPLAGRGISNSIEDGLRCGNAIFSWLQNETAPLEQLARDRVSEVSSYFDDYTTHYKKEQRWKSSPFWARRTQNANLRDPRLGNFRHSDEPPASDN